MLKRITIALFSALLSGAVWAQSTPHLSYGQIPTAAMWNSFFAGKQDLLNYVPVNKSGDIMQGLLVTSAPSSVLSGFRLPPGTAPASPVNGDLWTTSAGIFVRINGGTVGPLATAASFAITVGSTAVGAGTSGYVLYNNGGFLGNLPATGSAGSVVLSDGPSISGGSIVSLASLAVRDTSAAFDVTLAATSSTNLTSSRNLTFDVQNGSRVLSLGNNLTVTGSGTPVLAFGTGSYTYTFPGVSDTLVTLAASQTLTSKTLTAPVISGGTVNNTTIGATTPNTGKFTSLIVTGNVQFNGASGGSVAYALCTDSSGNVVPNSSANCYSGGSAGAGGSTTQVQYNSSGTLAGNAGWTYDGTSVTSLGVAGTSVGGLKLFNATSGYTEILPPTGALGTSVWTLQAASDTFVGRATTDTLTNKSIAGSEINSGTIGGTYGGTGVNNGASTITLAGSLVTTGAYTSTFAASGAYTYTMPGATSTLAAIGVAQTWTAIQKVTNSDICLLGSSTGCTTLTSANAGASNYTLTLPAVTDTLATLGTASQAMSGGVHLTPYSIGTVSSGTTTIDCGKNPAQYLTNGGAFLLAAPANDSSCLVLVTNNGSAGAITFSGFTVGANTGDPLDTGSGDNFTLSVWRINGVSSYLIKALQ